MDPNSKEFKALQKKWYGKLKAEEFNDIEQADGNLKTWASSAFSHNFNETLFEAKETYYRLARQFLHSHPFQDKKEHLIWSLHSEGVSVRNIVKALKTKRFKAHKDGVHSVVQRLANLMLKRNDE